jgi:oligoendopeptidase F
MKKILISITILVFSLITAKGYSQTSGVAGTSGSSSGTSALTSFIGQGNQNQQQGMQEQAQNLLVSIIGNMLRDPNASVRKEALMSIIAAITSSTNSNGNNNSNNNNNGSITNIFSMNTNNNNNSNNGNNGTGTVSGLGGAAFIPDLYTLLSDPDHTVRALAAVAIDEVFGSDVTLLNYLKSSDPMIRKYALELIVAQGLSQSNGNGNSNNNNTNNISKNMLTLRILLKMLNDPDPGVRAVAQQAINIMINYGIRNSGNNANNINSNTSLFNNNTP